jgi:hypothetical protein
MVPSSVMFTDDTSPLTLQWYILPFTPLQWQYLNPPSMKYKRKVLPLSYQGITKNYRNIFFVIVFFLVPVAGFGLE